MGSINKIKSLTEKIPEGEKPRVLVAAYPDADKKTIYTFAKIDTLSNMVSLAGGKTIAADLPDFLKSSYRIEVDPEWVIEQDPDYIILLVVATTYSGVLMDPPSGYEADDPTGMKKALEAFQSRPEFSNLTAVKSGHVYIISGNMRNDASKGLIGAAYLAKIFHSDKLGDLDPEELHKEYLQKFLGLSYNLDEHGVFIYPPLVKDGRLEGVPDSYYQNLLSANTTAKA
jgi:iron complex transport system substrate-binding protein